MRYYAGTKKESVKRRFDMETIKKLKDALDAFEKEMQVQEQKFSSITAQYKSMEPKRQELLSEIKRLEEKKNNLDSAFNAEWQDRIAQIDAREKQVNDARSEIASERGRQKVDSLRIQTKERELDRLILQNKEATNGMIAKKNQFDEKMKKIGEAAVS